MKKNDEFYEKNFKLIQSHLAKSGICIIDPNKKFREIIIQIGKNYYELMKSKEF